MVDNWSLKNKKRICDTKFFDIKPQRGTTIVDVYLKEDIEILRQKLIEDIIQLEHKNYLGKYIVDIDNKPHFDASLVTKDLLRIINKRFKGKHKEQI